MNSPPVPPDVAVIRLARVGAGISVARAATLAQISKARWVQIENGRETRRGQVRPARAKRVTIAHMAFAVGLSPERLETEGQNPEAATILREIMRQQDVRRAPTLAAPERLESESQHRDAAEVFRDIFRQEQRSHEPLATPPPAVKMSGAMSQEVIDAAAPYATEILLRLQDLAAEGNIRPSGSEVFAVFSDADADARRWDEFADELPDEELVWLIAGLRARDAASGRDSHVERTA